MIILGMALWLTIDGIPIMDFTPEALLSLVVIMVLLGKLIPRRNYDDLRKDYDRLLETTDRNSASLEKLLTHAETTNAILSALPKPKGMGELDSAPDEGPW